MSNYRIQFCLSMFFLFSNICFAKICLPRKHVALFVFGDSLFDVGNNNYINTTTDMQANIPPYGETFFKYSTGRFSDGRVIPDFIDMHFYAKLPLILPYLHPAYTYQQYINGANFASAGAGALVETREGLVIDLNTQLTYFKNVHKLLRERLGEAETKNLLSRAVYLISIGSNDYIVQVVGNSSAFSSYSQDQYVDIVIGNLTNVIKEIYKKGGRKFGFLESGPLGCLPLGKMLANGTGSCWEDISALPKLHNSALSAVLQKLKKQLRGFRYSYTNFYDLETDLMNYPSKYGFKEGNVACCGTGPYRGFSSCGGKGAVKEYELCDNPNNYVFFDSAHPTERANQFFAQQMWSGNDSVTVPQNLKTLFED
ncbi:hypothetical protein L6164_004159 [Bauhinia variegata]|uniref:Uncharacterized protein n=1 Tax=Bauhinia variegata TaxID=167791 RepID=A0ACB9Q2M7_BAUVA|nr:hypothetical protein L6164_004159 [Bauhinia variegata]